VIVKERCPPELEGTNVELTEDLLSHGIPIALVKRTSLGGLEATSSPTTGHTVRGPMLAFVDNYIVLEGAVPFGLSICRSPMWSEIGQRTYGEINISVQPHFTRLAAAFVSESPTDKL
jgi:hypothetical protein